MLFTKYLPIFIENIGRDWHLKKTNWCGEAAENLTDEVRKVVLKLITVYIA